MLLDAARTLRGMAITFSVTGKPVPQPRPHTTKAGHTYYPDNGIRAYRAAVAAAARAVKWARRVGMMLGSLWGEG